jgi:hypothetical protein
MGEVCKNCGGGGTVAVVVEGSDDLVIVSCPSCFGGGVIPPEVGKVKRLRRTAFLDECQG